MDRGFDVAMNLRDALQKTIVDLAKHQSDADEALKELMEAEANGTLTPELLAEYQQRMQKHAEDMNHLFQLNQESLHKQMFVFRHG